MKANSSIAQKMDMSGQVAIITGGSGLLGREHAVALAECGAVPVLLDINTESLSDAVDFVSDITGVIPKSFICDITSEKEIKSVLSVIEQQIGFASILINNAANNPKVEGADGQQWSRLENFPLETWERDIAVGLTGAWLCSRIFGAPMAEKGKGVILNIASDLALIAPDQRIYRKDGVEEHQQPVKPVTYSVVKSGLIGLTRYLATYWAASGVRCNALCPGGIENNQDPIFVKKLSSLIPLGRMAYRDEYRAIVSFLCSDASSYMTGSIVPIDGGRTAW